MEKYLVLKYFKGIDKENPYVIHLDWDCTNNNLSNLQWADHHQYHEHQKSNPSKSIADPEFRSLYSSVIPHVNYEPIIIACRSQTFECLVASDGQVVTRKMKGDHEVSCTKNGRGEEILNIPKYYDIKKKQVKSVTRAELVLQSHTRVPTHLQHEVYRDGVTSKCHLDNLKAATENKWIESVCTDLEAMYGEEFRSTGEFLSHNLKFYLISHEDDGQRKLRDDG